MSLLKKHNAKVRAAVLAKVKGGHKHIRRDIGGVPHVALDYGKGQCSSSFVRMI